MNDLYKKYGCFFLQINLKNIIELCFTTSGEKIIDTLSKCRMSSLRSSHVACLSNVRVTSEETVMSNVRNT